MLLVVVASTRDRDLVLQALGAGVHGYVPMDLSAEEMLGAFKSVLSGQIYVPKLMSEVCAKQLAVAPGSGSHDLSFTDRQSQVLALMTAGRSNKEIARTLHIAEGTVKVHITAAFRVLGVHNRVSAAAAIRYRPQSDPMSEASIAS